MTQYDAIVVGTGGIGSAALWYVARRGGTGAGNRSLPTPLDRGSSHGQSRIFRQAYFEDPDYVPLLAESYRQWSELETLSRQQLFYQLGVLQIGAVDGTVVSGVLSAARRHGLEVEQYTSSEVQHRWPGMNVPDKLVGVLEKNAGFLAVEDCVSAQLQAAGLSGHGFKFASVLGQDLADLALEGATQLPIGFLSLNRFDH